MPPLRFCALTVADEPAGSERRIGPFTVLIVIGWQLLILLKSASRLPLIVERSVSPSIFSTLIFPLTLDAFTPPVTPLIESAPFTSLTFSRYALRGTMMGYSTAAEFSASEPLYWVRMETRPSDEST